MSQISSSFPAEQKGKSSAGGFFYPLFQWLPFRDYTQVLQCRKPQASNTNNRVPFLTIQIIIIISNY